MSLFRRLIQRTLDLASAQQTTQLAEAAPTTVVQPTTSVVPPDPEVITEEEVTTLTEAIRFRGRYIKTRRSILRFRVDPLRSGGSPLQPATQTVPGPEIEFSVNDTRARYKWEGDFGFDNAEYEFTIKATEKFQVRLDGVLLIDEFNSGPTRSRNKTVPVSAGNHEVTIDWRPNGLNTLDFNFAKVFDQSWVSCVDGETREGDPPETWIKTRSGCFKPPLTDDDGTVDLLQVLDISPGADTRIERAYIKGSGTGLQAHRMKFLNRSTNMTIGVKLNGPKPIRFVTARQIVGDVGVGGLPADGFELGTREEKLVDVVFIPRELDALPEALIRSEVLVSVSAGTITISKDGDDNIDIGTPIDDGDIITLPVDPPDPPPPPPPPTPTWRDCSGTTEVVRDGFPPSNFVLRADGCYVAPVPVAPKVTLIVSSVEFPAQFDGSTPIARANLRPTITAGRSAWSWRWNFDVNRQGSGTGNTSAQDPVASWRMNSQDSRNLLQLGRTTRVVEAVATRRGGLAAGQIVRTKHTVILDDARLRSFREEEEFDFLDPEGGDGFNFSGEGGFGGGSGFSEFE